MQYLD